MIESTAKVTIDASDEGVVIAIIPDTKAWQKAALAIWSGVWTFTGVIGMVGMLKEASQEAMTFLLVFFAFWAYFLFYALRSLIWHRVGAEYIRISDENMDYKRSWGSYGTVRSYDLTTMKNLGMVNYEDKKFARSYSQAFWTIGGEMIGFDYLGRKVALGFKLDEGLGAGVFICEIPANAVHRARNNSVIFFILEGF